ncbi:unnamed protein product [Scytosiphon promiscuus]
MAPSTAWRTTVGAMLAFVSSTFAPTAVDGFALSAAKLNKVAGSGRRPLDNKSRRLTPTATAMLPAAAAAVAAATGQAAALALLADGGLLDEMDPAKLGLFAFAGLGVAAAGFSTAVYWRMQYVVAALLTNRVPVVQGGAEVLELSAKDTKTLYYMPTGGVRRLTLSTVKDLESEIVNGAAIQAKIPTALVRKQEGSKVSCNSGTMDCVVSVYGFSGGVAAAEKGGGGGGTSTLKGLVSEVARVLKPGGTVLFVEKGESMELVDELREALGTVEVNMVTNLVDPYCVAMGTKTKALEEGASRTSAKSQTAGEGEGGNRRDRRQRKKAAAAASSTGSSP